jgi:23S rRNA (uridine2552-2'-O)-methyltransferase
VTGKSESGGGGRRSLSGGHRKLHTPVKTARKRSVSSARWLERHLNDPYVAASKREGLRSRAAFKLREIDSRYHVLKPGQRVVDLGAAPGGWSQVAAERVKAAEGRGQVIAVDYLSFEPIPGVEIIQMDFTDPGAEKLLKSRLRGGRADVVLSDMAAPTIGHAKTDHLRIMGLAESAAAFAIDVLEPGGVFLCKVFQGGTERDLLDALKRAFSSVRHVKPPASRAESSELYVLAMGFRGPAD